MNMKAAISADGVMRANDLSTKDLKFKASLQAHVISKATRNNR
jgi:hypothetical protein